MRFFGLKHTGPSRYPFLLLVALLMVSALPVSSGTAGPHARGVASVATRAADDVLGQLANMDFAQPDFTHGAANDSLTPFNLTTPRGVAVDSQNHRLFVADGNSRILVFDLTASNTLADRVADRVLGQPDFKSALGGIAANRVGTPNAIAYDPSGNRLFVLDNGNRRVLVFDVATIDNGEDAVLVLGQADFISNGAFGGQSGLNNPWDLAYDTVDKRLFVADRNSHRIMVFDVASITNGENAVAVLGQPDFTSGGSGLAINRLNAPHAVTYDSPAKRLFVADNSNHRVLVYDVNTVTDGEAAVAVLGQADFVSGTANRGGAVAANTLSSPYGLAYDTAGNRLFVAEQGNDRVAVYNLNEIVNGEPAEAVLGQADLTSNGSGLAANRLNDPRAIAFDATSSRLYVSDETNHRIVVYDALAITTGEDAVDVVGQLDESGNAVFTTRFQNTSANVRGLSVPSGILVDAAGRRLFVSDRDNTRVLVYELDASGRLLDRRPDLVLGETDFASRTVTNSQSGLHMPRGLAFDPAGGRLFVADSGIFVDFGGNRVMIYATSTITNGQNAVNVLGQGDFTSRAAAITAAGMDDPRGLAYDATGNRLFVSDNSNGRVLVYDVSAVNNGEAAVAVLGQANLTTAGSNTTQGGLAGPQGLAYDPVGQRLFVADAGNHRVVIYDVAAVTDGENAIAVLGQADFTSGLANRGGAIASNTLNAPSGVTYDPDNSRLFVSEISNNRVVVYDVATITNGEDAVAVLGQADFTSGTANRGGSVAANTVSTPLGLGYDTNSRTLYVADSVNNRVLLFNAAPISTTVSINGGSLYATAITATLTLTATDATQMQVSDSATFTGASYQAYTTTVPFTLTVGDGTKTVHARFRDSALGVSTAVSDTIILDTTAPATFTLSTPVTGTITTTASPAFSWEASTDATSGLSKYQLYVDGVLSRDNITSTASITTTSPITDGLHSWKVVAVDNATNSRESSSLSFTVDSTPPLTVTLSSPITGTFTSTTRPLFSWAPTSDATTGLAKYQLYIDGVLNRDNIATTTTSITPTTALADGAYSWKVIAVDNAGNSRESDASTLTVDTVSPTVSQVSVAASTPVSATITWVSSEPTSSQVEYGTTTSYGSTTAEADVSTRVISHTVAITGLAPGNTIHYRVKSRDGAGNTAVSSDSSFSTFWQTFLPVLPREHATGW